MILSSLFSLFLFAVSRMITTVMDSVTLALVVCSTMSLALNRVDATHKGNLGRFLNHSCDANVGIWPLANENIFKQRLVFWFVERQVHLSV